jgi:hypothetical protein
MYFIAVFQVLSHFSTPTLFDYSVMPKEDVELIRLHGFSRRRLRMMGKTKNALLLHTLNRNKLECGKHFTKLTSLGILRRVIKS